ncbi:MAG: TIGR02757 family protein [Tenacibaculum sp.]
MKMDELKDFLNQKVIQYNKPDFIETDPIKIPHQFHLKQDIEIAGFLSATIAWGNRKIIINNAQRMMNLMGNSPCDFVLNHSEKNLAALNSFVHRTFNAQDFVFFIKALQNIYQKHCGLEAVLKPENKTDNYQNAIHNFKNLFFEIPHPSRTLKHISDPIKNSASKRINMFLRWMVRKDKAGVDFGIWKTHYPKNLHCPLDVHSAKVARKLGVLSRKQNDWKALRELDSTLRSFDSEDPAKYDFALFGLGIFEKF